MADYDALLGPEMRAFIAEAEATYPPDAIGAPMARQRAAYDALCARFARPHPPGVTVRNVALGALALRHYCPSGARGQVLYLHGGGFVLGGLDSHDSICADLAATSGACVLAVAYRLAPEHPHPAALQDGQAALDWLAGQAEGPVVLAGDSAGATLAAALAHANRNLARLAGQVLIYPWLGAGYDTPSMQAHANAPMLTRADMQYYEHQVLGGQGAAPSLFVLQGDDLAGLPTSFILTAECDPLASDGHLYAAALARAGIAVQLWPGHGLVHGFLRARASVPAAAAAFAALGGAIGHMVAMAR